jgi:hypothetical protein
MIVATYSSSTSKLAIPVVLVPWSPPRIVGVAGDSVYPDAQDPEAQEIHGSQRSGPT